MIRPAAFLVFALAACASDGDSREAAYQQCLKESQAVAMSWAAIEEMCRDRAGTEDPLDDS